MNITPFVRDRVTDEFRRLTKNGLEIETAIFVWAKHQHQNSTYSEAKLYSYKVRQLVYAYKNNHDAIRGYTPDELVLLDNNELNAGCTADDAPPALHHTTFDDLDRDDYEAIPDDDRQVMEDNSILKCHKCGSNSVTWTLKQTRGADEPMTAFCICNNCSTRWKK